jgi:hypothetical protein
VLLPALDGGTCESEPGWATECNEVQCDEV